MEATETIEQVSQTVQDTDDTSTLIEQLYLEAFPSVARFVRSAGGDEEEARDVFQDALIIFYEKLAAKNVLFEVSRKAYLLGICKHLWLRKARAKNSEVHLETWEQLINVPELSNPQPSATKLLALLEVAGQKCLNLLKSFYYDRLNIRQIASEYGFGSERSATVQKYKCLEKVRNEIKSKALSYEDFTD